MLSRHPIAALLVAALACSEGPTVPEIPPVTGAWCANTTPTVTRSGSEATVKLPESTTEYRDVRRSDGVVVRQEVRGCTDRTCYYTGASGYSDAQLIELCRN